MKLMDFYEKFYKEEMEAAERQLYVTNSEPEVANESEHIEEEESSFCQQQQQHRHHRYHP